MHVPLFSAFILAHFLLFIDPDESIICKTTLERKTNMALDFLRDTGYPIERQLTSWKNLVQEPVSKLDDDAFTKVRLILMNGQEMEAINFSRSFARVTNTDTRRLLAKVRRVEQQQATTINWLLPADLSPLETTIAYEQVAIEITAAVAQIEPDSYLAQCYRFGLLEDFDHMYRYAALLDRMEGKDAQTILQGYTDILPGRPTFYHHRHPEDDVRNHYDAKTADSRSKINALTIMAAEQQTWNYYMNIGPMFSDPVARQLYAEIASVEEQHVTHYGSMIDPNQTWLEQWVMHEANEAFLYYSCLQQESNSRVKAIWEQFLDYELGQLNEVVKLFENIEKRDVAEILPQKMPEPIAFASQREFVRECVLNEVDLITCSTDFVDKSQTSEQTKQYRNIVHADGDTAAAISRQYWWAPGGELNRKNPPEAPAHGGPFDEQKGVRI
jgi:rubrerythrin